MELLHTLFDFALHLDHHLAVFIANYGPWVYALLFAIIYAETGLVVTPWLPGDSLLFVVGTLAGTGSMDIAVIMPLLMLASFLGDTTNYFVGRFVGLRLFHDDSRFFKRSYLDKTHAFYRAHGGKTVVIARFIPIIRTFAPFVAGIGHMGYPRFAVFSIGGSILWVGSLVGAGYLLGNIPLIKDNLTVAILAIIGLSLLPGFITYLRHRHDAKPG